MKQFYSILEDHTTQGKIAFMHALAAHLVAINADPAAIATTASWFKIAAGELEKKLAAGIDAGATALEAKIAAGAAAEKAPTTTTAPTAAAPAAAPSAPAVQDPAHPNPADPTTF